MTTHHKGLASGRWQTLTLAEQMGNIGSEVSRASLKRKKEKEFQSAVERALELFDLTLADPRWRGRYREIERAREVFCDATLGGDLYKNSLFDLVPYFDEFAIMARKRS